MKFLVACVAWGLIIFLGLHYFFPNPPAPDVVSSRVRYPGEEAAAKKACGERKVMYWWITDPRRGGAVLHAECAGRISKTVEVRF